jgi:ArsR family transcriptional regulator
MNKNADQPEALLKWMGCLADPTRLRLLRVLEKHELGVCDLCEIVQLPQSTVSRHLKLLADDGWVAGHRHGTTNLYRMAREHLTPAQQSLWTLAREQTNQWAAVGQDQLRLLQRLRQRRDDSQAFFAGAAAEWDKTRQELYGSSFSREAIMALLPHDWIVADLGCGTGMITVDLARHVGKVIAVDNSTPMLKAARQRTRDLQNVEVRQGDLEMLPIDDATCDAAVLSLVLAYVPEPAIVLSQMRRILKPGGKAVVVDLLHHDREEFRRQVGQQCLGFEPQQLQSMLADAGFKKKITCAPLTPEPKAKGPALLLATAVR